MRGLIKITSIPFLFVLIAACSDSDERSNYRYPLESDIKGGWEYAMKTNPEPYHIRGDFNGDGTEDEAWVLVKKEVDGWAAYAYMSSKNGPKEILLASSDKGYAQNMGLRVKQKGTYKTACAKGYGPACRPDEPKEIILNHPGIELFQFESSSSVFYWDDAKEEFQRVWLSD